MAELIEDIFIRILYEVYPEMPLVLLVNKLARAIVPPNDKMAKRCLKTSWEFHRHNRDTFKNGVHEIYGRVAKIYSMAQLRPSLPFGHLHSCWFSWEELVEQISRKTGRERTFYDNLAFRLFRHCVLNGKTYLMGGTTPRDIKDIVDGTTLWNSFTMHARTWSWPASQGGQDSFDVLAVSIRDLPPIYIRYAVFNDCHSLHVTAEFFGSSRNSRDECGEAGSLGYLPEVETQLCFLNSTTANIDHHISRFAEYTQANPVAYSSLADYKCCFVEKELYRTNSELLNFLLKNHCFVDHIKTTEELSRAITMVERVSGAKIVGHLKEARNWTYTKCACKIAQ